MPTKDELRILQALPLEMKLKRTEIRANEFIDYFGVENCAVAFSGGKDSTVLVHIVRKLYPDIELVFCNTTLEYPEIQKFAKSFDNVTILYPKLTYAQVIQKYGYPFISKEVAERVYNARRCLASYKFDGGVQVHSTLLSAHRNISRCACRNFSELGVSLAEDMIFQSGAIYLPLTFTYQICAATK